MRLALLGIHRCVDLLLHISSTRASISHSPTYSANTGRQETNRLGDFFYATVAKTADKASVACAADLHALARPNLLEEAGPS